VSRAKSQIRRGERPVPDNEFWPLAPCSPHSALNTRTPVSIRTSGRIQRLFSATPEAIVGRASPGSRVECRESRVESQNSASGPGLSPRRICDSALDSQLLDVFMCIVSSDFQPSGRAAESKTLNSATPLGKWSVESLTQRRKGAEKGVGLAADDAIGDAVGNRRILGVSEVARSMACEGPCRRRFGQRLENVLFSSALRIVKMDVPNVPPG